MPEPARTLVYEFGQWQVNLGRRELLAGGVPVAIGARAFAIVEVLVSSANELVTKDDLMDRIWPGATIGEHTLHVHISAIRKALGWDRTLLKSASGRGYRLLGSWTIRRHDSAEPPVGVERRPAAAQAGATNLPAAVSALVGRSVAVQWVEDLVSAYRVVTLTGPGGIGKTSLALEVARGFPADFDGDRWYVELASMSDPGLVPSAVATVLGLKLTGEISTDAIARAVGERHILLLLDNCEHVIDAVASLVELIVQRCPRVTILATSREALRLAGEHVYRVAPLEVPAAEAEEPDHILRHSAVELFVARIQALESDFVPRDQDMPTIAAICRRLDGIPLAIEFAAARAATFGIPQVAVGLNDRFALLVGGHRNALARHRTLRATLDWSYELLPETERLLLRRLAVFPTAFSLDAAVAVMQDAGMDTFAVLDRIGNIVSKSLATLDGAGAGSRWSLLETVRAYAREKLVANAEAASTARHHATYFRDFLVLPAGPATQLPNDELAGRAREIDNVRAALDWSFSADGDTAIGVQLAAAYVPVWLYMSLIGECRDRCAQALSAFDANAEPNARLQMELQIAFANTLIATLGSPAQAVSVLTRALATADTLSEPHSQARALAALSAAQLYSGHYDGARAALERLRRVAVEIDDPGIISVADQRIGTRLLMAGRLRDAQECFERLLRSPMPPENRRRDFWNYLGTRAMARALLARALCLRGFPASALREAQASVAEAQNMDHPLSVCRVLNYGICRIAVMTGDFTGADRAITRSIEVATRLNAPFWQVVGQLLEGKLLVERGEFARGIAVLRDGFAVCDRSGWRISYPEFRGSLAAAHVGLGQSDEALVAVDDAIANSGPQHGQMWYLPELLRIKGEALLQHGSKQNVSDAESCFDEAGETARKQEARWWELRIALSVARLRVRQGRTDDARTVLRPVHDRFTEGFETLSLRQAKAMLDDLAS